MSIKNHVFHTKHDFTPELGWAAFQLLAELGIDGIKPAALHASAKAVASPLTKRSALNKLLAAMLEVGLVERAREEVRLSRAGAALTAGIGRYETGFCMAVHCLYAWKWMWDGDMTTASPSWSYREVLKQILAAGSTGIDVDEIVLRVVSAAERFDAMKVSFSRSSVSGVTMWLASQALPLIKKKGQRILLPNSSAPLADSVRLHVAALCALGGGEATLNDENRQLLAESFLIGADEWLGPVTNLIRDPGEFLFIPTIPSRVIFKGSEDPFIAWMVKYAARNSKSTSDGESNIKGHNGFVSTITRGAGGNWRTIDEVTDATVIRQSSSMNCGAACGEMLLRSQGVLVSQEVIAAIAGAPSSTESLAAALDDLDTNGTWFGSGVTESSFEALNHTGLWAAMLFAAGARFGHWVCVSGLDHAGRVMMLDPADGTRYAMDIEEFMSHWTLFCVFRR